MKKSVVVLTKDEYMEASRPLCYFYEYYIIGKFSIFQDP